VGAFIVSCLGRAAEPQIAANIRAKSSLECAHGTGCWCLVDARRRIAGEISGMPVFEQKRDRMIEYLERALALADELNDSTTGYLIERALDEARAAMVPSPAEAPRQ
jgi:hypothetical protein